MLKIIETNRINILGVLLVLILLSALRNISQIYYLTIICLTAILLIYAFINHSFRTGFIASIFYIFLLYSALLVTWSAIYMQSLDFIPGIPRLFMVLIFTLLALLLVSEKDFKLFYKLILFCYIVAAISVIYQILFDAISWFAPQFVRAGLDRYASMLGSLTIYGSIVGYGLIMLYSEALIPKKLVFKIILGLILISAAVFSLTKSGVVMVFLSFIVYSLYDFRSILKRASLKGLFLLILIFTVMFTLLMQINEFREYYNVIVTQTIGGSSFLSDGTNVMMDSDKVSIEHINKRLFHFTSEMLKYYGDSVYFIGVGLQGGAGTLGITNNGAHYISAHNAIGDLFFIGGAPYLFLFLLLYGSTQLVFLRNNNDILCRLFFMLNILFFANLLAASGSAFHPAISLPFWISIVYASIKSKSYKLTVATN